MKIRNQRSSDYRKSFREMTPEEVAMIINFDIPPQIGVVEMAPIPVVTPAPAVDKKPWFSPKDHFLDQLKNDVALDLATSFEDKVGKVTFTQIADSFRKACSHVQDVTCNNKGWMKIYFDYNGHSVEVKIQQIIRQAQQALIHLTG